MLQYVYCLLPLTGCWVGYAVHRLRAIALGPRRTKEATAALAGCPYFWFFWLLQRRSNRQSVQSPPLIAMANI